MQRFDMKTAVFLIVLSLSAERFQARLSTKARFLSEERSTYNNCKCKKTWTEEGVGSCDNYCCNPDNDTLGKWCQVEDMYCEDADWGYCQENSSASAVSAVEGCSDVDWWVDSDGDGCREYEALQWCTKDGKAALGWHGDEWGTFINFSANGYSAMTACCACGGGIGGAAFTPEYPPEERYTYNNCKCQSVWWDDYDDCEGACCNPDADPAGDWCYVEDMSCEDSSWGYCRSGGLDTTVHNVSSGDRHGHCTDVANFVDPDGDDCWSYANFAYCTEIGGYGLGWNMDWGTFASFQSDVGTADVACCACGGGVKDADYNNVVAAAAPAADDKELFTWSGCACKKTWEDSLGKCDSYCCNPDNDPLGNWCNVVDKSCELSDWGYCQSSGLGTVPRPLQDAAHCNDRTGENGRPWADTDGDTCDAYSNGMYCDARGGPGPGWNEEWGKLENFSAAGHTALTACCACGGGIRLNPDATIEETNALASLTSMFQDEMPVFWQVVKGPCKADNDGCVMSGNYPEPYNAEEKCQIVVKSPKPMPITVVSFDTEETYDVLRVNGLDYSGTTGPKGVLVQDTIHWGADSSLQGNGWKICLRGEGVTAAAHDEKHKKKSSGLRLLKLIVTIIMVLLLCCCLAVVCLGWRLSRSEKATAEEKETFTGTASIDSTISSTHSA